MEYWLYQQLILEDSDREPRLALQSTINWARSLSFEIVQEHGDNPKQQYESCLQIFRTNTQGNGANLGNSAVFEPLYSALTNTLTVVSLASDSENMELRPWFLPSVIVSWYYSVYTSIRAILSANNITAPDTHAGVIKTINNSLRNKLPHPLNMRADWIRNEEFTKQLPDYPESGSRELTSSFEETRTCAQEMLLGYLSGTRKREIDIIKERLKKKHKLNNFRTKEARRIRDEEFKSKQFNFMNCAFRYRGKANYRDAIFITYGTRGVPNSKEFVHALATSSRFVFICAMAFISYRMGESTFKAFVSDLSKNLRGINRATTEERFWIDLVQ